MQPCFKLSCHVFSVRGVWTGLHAVLQLLAHSEVQVWRWLRRSFSKDPILRSFFGKCTCFSKNTLVQTVKVQSPDMPWRASVRCTTLTPGYPWHVTHAATVVNIASPLIIQCIHHLISLLSSSSCSSNISIYSLQYILPPFYSNINMSLCIYISTFLQQYWHISTHFLPGLPKALPSINEKYAFIYT